MGTKRYYSMIKLTDVKGLNYTPVITSSIAGYENFVISALTARFPLEIFEGRLVV